jgi:hypothetical protein
MGSVSKIIDLIKKNKIINISFIVVIIIIFSGVYISYQNNVIADLCITNNTIKENNSTIQISQADKKQKTSNIYTDEEIKIGEPITVNTEHGTYKYTIEKAIKTDEFNEWDKNIKNNNQLVIELFIECENIDFQNEKYKGVEMYNAFTVKDNNNYNLQHYNKRLTNFSDGNDVVLPNSKSKICILYIDCNKRRCCLCIIIHVITKTFMMIKKNVKTKEKNVVFISISFVLKVKRKIMKMAVKRNTRKKKMNAVFV